MTRKIIKKNHKILSDEINLYDIAFLMYYVILFNIVFSLNII